MIIKVFSKILFSLFTPAFCTYRKYFLEVLHCRDHILQEMESVGIGNFIRLEEEDENTWNWKTKKPEHLFEIVDEMMMKTLEM